MERYLEGNGHGLIELFCLGGQWETTKKHESEYPDVSADILPMGLSHCSFIHCQSVPNFCIHQSPSLHGFPFTRLLVPTKVSCSFPLPVSSLLFSFLYIHFNLQLNRCSHGLWAGRPGLHSRHEPWILLLATASKDRL